MPKKSFDQKFSDGYDERIRRIFPEYEHVHQISQHLLHVFVAEQALILMAGVGTGHEVIVCAQQRPQWEIIGFEPSAAMLRVAQQKIEGLSCRDRVSLKHGTVADLKDARLFDGVTSVLVMQFLPDNGEKEQYLAALSERMKKNAPILVVDLEGAKRAAQYRRYLAAWQAYQHASRTDKEKIVKDCETVATKLHLVSEKRMRQLLAGAGFKGICKFYQSLLLAGYCAQKK